MIIGIPLLAIVGLIAAFSFQNVTPVSVSLLYWRFEATLPALVCVSVLLGVIVEQLVRQLMAKLSVTARKP